MWLLITIIKLPVTALAGTEAVTILRWLVEGFSQILGAFAIWLVWGAMGVQTVCVHECVCVCVCVCERER